MSDQITIDDLIAEMRRLESLKTDCGGMRARDIQKKIGCGQRTLYRKLSEWVEGGVLEARMVQSKDVAGRPSTVPMYFPVKKTPIRPTRKPA